LKRNVTRTVTELAVAGTIIAIDRTTYWRK
jgi:hypothetical protein